MNNSQNVSNYDAALGLIQVLDVLINLSQVSNDTLLEELQKQNREYLEKIVMQNEDIQGNLNERTIDILERQNKIIQQNEEIIQQNEEIKAQGRNLYQMQEKIWGDINELLDRSEGK